MIYCNQVQVHNCINSQFVLGTEESEIQRLGDYIGDADAVCADRTEVDLSDHPEAPLTVCQSEQHKPCHIIIIR